MPDGHREIWVVVSEEALVIFESTNAVEARRLSISLVGGIRAPKGEGWMAGHGPDTAVLGCLKTADWSLIHVDDGAVVASGNARAGQLLDLRWPTAGTFRIEARADGMETSAEVRIIAWETLRTRPAFRASRDDRERRHA